MESGVVLCVPELAPAIDRWRTPSVPSAALGGPVHVTCLFPWQPAPVTPRALAELRRSVRGFGAVTLTFRWLGTFPTGVLYLLPEPEETVRRLMRRVQAAFPMYPPYGGQFPDPQPHEAWCRNDHGKAEVGPLSSSDCTNGCQGVRAKVAAVAGAGFGFVVVQTQRRG